MSNFNRENLDLMIEHSRSNGEIFLETDDGIIGFQTGTEDQVTELIIDTNRLLILGISVYKNNLIEQRMMFDIDGDYTAPIINSMLVQTYELSPTSNVRVIRETQMDFDNFQFFNSKL